MPRISWVARLFLALPEGCVIGDGSLLEVVAAAVGEEEEEEEEGSKEGDDDDDDEDGGLLRSWAAIMGERQWWLLGTRRHDTSEAQSVLRRGRHSP